MPKRICTKCFVIGLLLALACVFGLPFFSSAARAADDADIDMAVAVGVPADESTPEESLATETAPQGEDQTADEASEDPAGADEAVEAPEDPAGANEGAEAVDPAGQDTDGELLRAPTNGTNMRVDLLFYKVAGYYNPSVSPSVYGGGTKVTIDDSTPVGFDEGQAFARLYTVDNGYVKVGHTVKTDRNFYTWTCIGFVPSQGDPSYGNWIRDHYLKEYCFETEDEATNFVREKGGVLYGEVPSEELLNTLKGYGSSASLIVVWTRVKPTLPESKYDYGDPIIDDVTPVNWQGTTEGIQVEASTETVEEPGAHFVNIVTYTVTIPEGMNEDVLNIDLSEVPVPDMPALQPGDDVQYRVVVQDESGHRYTYLENSGSLGTVLNGQNDDLGIGFEKYNIPAPAPTSGSGEIDMTMPGGYRIYGFALDELYQALEMQTNSQSMTDVRIGYALALAGYEYHDDDDLVKAYSVTDDVDEAWEGFRSDLKLIERYYDGDLEDALSEEDYNRAKTVLTDLTKHCFDDYLLDWANDRYSKVEGVEGEGPWFTSFKDAPQNIMWDIMNGTFFSGKQVENNRSVVNAMYYGFYEYFYQASPSRDGDKTGVYSIMKEQVQANPSELPEGYDASLATGNGFADEFASQWAAAGDDATEHELGWWHFIEGNANGNLMQDTFFFTSAQFKLVKPVVEVKVLKVWDDQDNKDGSRPASVTVKLQANGEDTSEEALTLDEDSEWSGGWQRLNRYADNKAIAYTVEETPIPTGYECDVTSESDGDGNATVTVKNSHTPEEPPTPDNPSKPGEPNKPGKSMKPVQSAKPKTALPATGDTSFPMTRGLFLLSAAAMAAAIGLRRVPASKTRG